MKRIIGQLATISIMLVCYSNPVNANNECEVGEVVRYQFPYFVNKQLVETSAVISFCFEILDNVTLTNPVSIFVGLDEKSIDSDAKYIQTLFNQANKYSLLGMIMVGDQQFAVVDFLFGSKNYTYTVRLDENGKVFTISNKQNTTPIGALLGHVFQLNKVSRGDATSDVKAALNKNESTVNMVILEVPEKIDFTVKKNIDFIQEQKREILNSSPDIPISTSVPDIMISLGDIFLTMYEGKGVVESQNTYAIESYLSKGDEFEVFNVRYSDDIITTLRNKHVFDQLLSE